MHIIGLYREHELSEIPVSWIKADLNQFDILDEILAKVDVVIHLAGLISYDEKDYKSLMLNNFQLTRELLNNCLFHKIQKFIYLSSSSTLGKSNHPFVISDKLQGRPIFYSNYAKSKYLGELEVQRAASEGLNAVILNPTLILGEGDWNKGSLSILKRMSEGLKFFPKGTVGIVDLQFVVKAILQSLEEEISIGPHLLHNYTTTYENLISLVAHETGGQVPKLGIPLTLALWFSRLEKLRCWFTGRKKVITMETAFLSSQTFSYIKEVNQFKASEDVESLEILIHRCISTNITY